MNDIALCAIHHLAYDRNLLGIDPRSVVHIARRLLDEDDGPMLRGGLQGFHGGSIFQPPRQDERPRSSPARGALRWIHGGGLNPPGGMSASGFSRSGVGLDGWGERR